MNLHREGTIRAALGYPAFRSLLAGLAVSQAGDWLYNLALVTLVYSRTHSALWAGVTTAARVVPIVALGPLGGRGPLRPTAERGADAAPAGERVPQPGRLGR